LETVLASPAIVDVAISFARSQEEELMELVARNGILFYSNRFGLLDSGVRPDDH
jgi:hypothetical protein